MDGRIIAGIVALAGLTTAVAFTQSLDPASARAAHAQAEAAEIYTEWEGFTWPTTAARPALAPNASAPARTLADQLAEWERAYAEDPGNAEDRLRGKPFRLNGNLDELMRVTETEALGVIQVPGYPHGWTQNVVINFSKPGPELTKGARVVLVGTFQQRLVDEENKVISYLFDNQTLEKTEAAAPQGNAPEAPATSGKSAPEAPAGEVGRFADLTKGFRFAGTVAAGDGTLAVFLTPEAKPLFVRPGREIADGMKLKALRPAHAVLSVDGERVEVTPW